MKRLNRFVALLLALTFPFTTLANPVGGTVVGGSATIAGQGTSVTTINQQSRNAVINWQGFSIAAGEITRFNQPSATASILNRVVSGNPTEIYGTLQGNGRIFVINPNGILVGRGGVVDTAGFMASTRNISDANLFSGRNLSLSGDSTAAVRNEGTIRALGGDVFLIGHTVENSGTISAPKGTVGLAAGSQVSLVQSGNEHISVLAGSGSAETGVNNQGVIEAASAELKAAGGNIYSLAINNGGAIRANTLVNEGGRIVLRASGGSIRNTGSLTANKANGNGGEIILDGGHNDAAPSTVTSSGTVQARGDRAGARGGKIQMTGDQVGLFDDSIFDVSGDRGGGSVIVGGDFRGANPNVQNAQTTYVSPNAQIRADALTSGHGGTVAVWSDGATRFYGSISAQGGNRSGNGGSVETSGHYLDFQGRVSTLAAHGSAGSLLLDPTDLIIDNTANVNVSGSSPFEPVAGGTTSHLLWSTINSALGSGAVTITTVGSPSTPGDSGNINIAAASPTLNRNNKLTIDAVDNINVNAAIVNNGTGGLELDAKNDVNINANITLAGGGALTVRSGSDGTGDVNFGTTVTVAANTQSYFAGDGPGGNTSGAQVDLVTHTPSFRGAAGGTVPPASFSAEQDGSFTDARTPLASQFGSTLPTQYTLQSDDGSLSVDTGSKLSAAGTTLTLSASDDLDINANLTDAAVFAHGGADGASGHNLTIASGVTIRADTQSYQAGSGSGTASLIDLHNNPTDPVFLTTGGSAGLTSFTFRQDRTIASGDLPSSGQFNNTLPSAYTIQSDGGSVALPAMTLPGTLTVQAHGDITESGALTVNAGSSSFTVDGTTGDVLLGTQANDFGSQTVTINATGTSGALNDVTLQNAGTGTISLSLPAAMNTLTLQLGGGVSLSALTVANNAIITAEGVVDFASASASHISGNLNITTDTTTPGFDVMQSGNGALQVDGISTFKTGTANVSLNKTGDNFNNVTITSANNVDLTDANAINLNNVTIGGYLHVIAGGKVDFTGTGSSTVGDNLSIVSTTGGITDSGTGSLKVNNGSTLTAGSANDITLNNGNDFVGAVNIVSANNVTLHDINALTVGGGMNGNLTTTVTAATTFNTLTVGGNLSATAGGLVDFAGSGASSITGTLGITTTAGGITDSGTGSLTVSGAATLTAGALNDITLNNNNNFNSVRVVTGNNVTLVDNNAIVLSGPSVISGTLSVTAGGTISQSGGPLTVTGGSSTFTINTVTADVLVGTQPNDFGNQTVTFNTINGGTLHDVSFRNDSVLASFPSLTTSLHTLTLQLGGAVNLPTLTLTGDLNVTAGGQVDFTGAGASSVTGNMNITTTTGGITDSGSGTLTVGGTSTLSAGLLNNITLDNFNNFNTVAASTANNVTLFDINGIDLGASTVAGTLSVTAGGNITQSGALTVAAGPSFFTINGVLADVLIGSQPNHFDSQTVTFNTINGGLLRDISFRNFDAGTSLPVISSAGTLRNFTLVLDSGGINLPTINLTGDLSVTAAGLVDFTGAGASTIGGNMNISTTAGGIAESGGGTITVAGLSTLSAGGLNNITLNTGNDFNTVTILSANNVALNDINGLNLGNLNANGNVTLNAGGLVDFVGSGASTIVGNLDITSSAGDVNDSGSGSLAVGGTTTLNVTSSHDVTLDNPNNDFNTVTIPQARNITVTDLNALNIGDFVSFGDVIFNAGGKVDFVGGVPYGTFGNLTVTTPAGGITQSGGGSLIVFGTANLSAGAGDITLANAGNDFNVLALSGANVTLNDADDINLGNLSISGNFNLTAAGLVDFVGSGASSIGAAMSINTTAGGINDSGSGSLAVVGPSTLTAGFGNNITLNNNNNFSSVAIVSANNVILNDVNALTVGGTLAGTLTTTAGGATTLNATTAGGGANITAAGDITENGVLSFTGGPSTFTINGVTANILLGSQANHFDAQAVTIAATGGGTVNDVNFRSADIGAQTPTLPATVHDLTLVFDNAGVAMPAVAVGGNLNVTANGPITDNAAFTVTGTTTLNAGPANDITLDAGDDFVGDVNIVSANNVFLSDLNALTVGGSMNGNLLTSVGTTTTFNTTSVGGNLTSFGNGQIAQNGNLTVVGTSVLFAGFGNDILLNGANDFGGAVTIGSAANATLNDINNLTVGGTLGGNLNTTAAGATTFNSLNVGGNLNAAGGPITQNAFTAVTVGGTTTLTAGGNDIILANGNDFVGTVTIVSGNNVTLNDVNSLALSGTIGGNLIASAGSGISDTANITVAGTTTLAGGSGDIVLNNADDFVGAVTIVNGNNVTLNDINSLTVGGSMNGTLTTTTAGTTTFNTVNTGGDLNATAGGQVDFAGSGASSVAGSLTINTPTGGITDSGAGSLTVGGTATLTAGAGNNITLDNNNNFNTVVIASGNNVTLNDVNAINLGNAAVSGNLAVTAGGLVDFTGAGATTVAGTLNIATTSGGIQDSGTGTLTVNGTSTLAGGAGGDIILDNPNDFVGAVTVNSGRNLTLNDINALTFNSVNISGDASITATGDITDNGNVNIGGNSTFTTAGGKDIILDSAGNTFGGSVNFGASSGTLQNVTVNDSDAGGFVISQISVSDTLTVTAAGNVTQSGNITADTLSVSSAAGSVTLGAAVPNIPDPTHPPSIFVSAAWIYDNTVNNVSGSVGGSGQFIFNGHNANPLNDLNVNNITTHGGTIALQSDVLNIQGQVNAGTGDVFLQPVTGTKIDVGGAAGVGLDPFNIDSDELHRITGRALVIGSATVNQAFVDPNLILRNNPAHIPNNTDSAGALNVDYVLLPANISDLNVFLQALAALSAVNIPLPKLDSFNFSGANLTAEDAKKLLPEGSKGELYLQLPMPALQEAHARIEENSKWTAGRLAASGGTAGPQTPQ